MGDRYDELERWCGDVLCLIGEVRAVKAPPDIITIDGHEYVRVVPCPRDTPETPEGRVEKCEPRRNS